MSGGMTTLAPYLAPLVPIAGRALLCIHWRSFMGELLPEEAQDRDVQRGYVLSLAGFSFTAVATFVLFDPAVLIQLQMPTWCALVSFVAFFAALNLHAYKASRWQNQLASALHEVGTLSLLLVLVALSS